MKCGLSAEQIDEIIEGQLEKNADILIGIDDPEMREMIDVLKHAISIAIVENNDAIEEYVAEYLKGHSKDNGRHF